MKKVLLVAAMLLIAAPVMATVSVTATDKGSGVVEVSYNCSAAEKVRAFALDIKVDNGLVINNIRDFNRGESKVPGGGYGIFPGSFANYINASSPNWADINYTPLGRTADPNTRTGLGTGSITVELGTLYVGPNSPGASGLLFRLDVNGNGVVYDGNLSIALNGTRGGIVTEDGNLAPSPVLTGTKVTLPLPCVTPTNEVGQTTATALAAWSPGGQGFTNIVGTPVVNCSNVGLVITNDQNCISLPTQLNYTYGIQATCPNVVGLTKAAAEAAITNAGLTIGAETGVFSDITPVNQVTVQSPASGTVTCSAVTLSYVCRTVHCLSPYCKGDVNRDKFVRSSDVTALTNLVSSYTAPTYRASNTTCQYDPCADINGDNFVRASDITALVNQISAYPSPTYRCSCGAAACPYYSGSLTP